MMSERWSPSRQVHQFVPSHRREFVHHELLNAHVVLVIVEDLVEELRNVRLQRQRRHAGSTDLMRVDDPVGAGLEELRLVLLIAGPCHDEKILANRPG